MRKAIRRTITTKTTELKEPKERKNKSAIITFRICQAICFGIFALGLSSAVGDITKISNIAISSFSTTTTIFGLLGSIITGILAKQCEKW